MASKGELIIIAPGAKGWDIWRGAKGGEFRLDHRGEDAQASDLKGLSGGELTMAFPVSEVTTVPFLLPSGETEIQDDAATMHVERLGVKVDPFGGQLMDLFAVEQTDEQAILLPAVLCTPEEGSMPAQAPSHFDLSSRIFPLPEAGVTLWLELGVWVFAFSYKGALVYSQATTSGQLDQALTQDIQLARTQLAIQGIEVSNQCLVWRSAEGEAPFDLELESFQSVYAGSVDVQIKPNAELPKVGSKLLPADVSAERRRKAARNRVVAICSIAAIAYLSLIGYFIWDYLSLKEKQKVVQRQAEELRGEAGAITDFIRVWDGDLNKMVDSKHYPVDILNSVVKSLPSGTVKFKEFDVSPEGNISIEAESRETKYLTAFRVKLLKSPLLRDDYEWNDPGKNKQTKGDGWGFRLEGTRRL